MRVWRHRSGMGVGGGQRKRVGLLELLGTRLAQLLQHVASSSQGHEFKPHVECRVYLRKKHGAGEWIGLGKRPDRSKE